MLSKAFSTFENINWNAFEVFTCFFLHKTESVFGNWFQNLNVVPEVKFDGKV